MQEREKELNQSQKEKVLIVKLQLHVKRCLEEALAKAIEDQQQKEQAMETMRKKYDDQIKELEEIKVKELQLLKSKLREEAQEQAKKANKERSLIQVLQMKARDAILKELEREKTIRLREQEESKQRFNRLLE